MDLIIGYKSSREYKSLNFALNIFFFKLQHFRQNTFSTKCCASKNNKNLMSIASIQCFVLWYYKEHYLIV